MSLIKFNPHKLSLYLRTALLPTVTIKYTRNYCGVQLGNPSIEALNGKEVGLENGILKANQHLRLNFGSIGPTKYDVFIAVNPELTKTCSISNPTILPIGTVLDEFGITLTTIKQTDISQLDWMITLYLLD